MVELQSRWDLAHQLLVHRAVRVGVPTSMRVPRLPVAAVVSRPLPDPAVALDRDLLDQPVEERTVRPLGRHPTQAPPPPLIVAVTHTPRFMRGGGAFDRLWSWQMSYLYVIAAWAAVVVFLFPPMFRFE